MDCDTNTQASHLHDKGTDRMLADAQRDTVTTDEWRTLRDGTKLYFDVMRLVQAECPSVRSIEVQPNILLNFRTGEIKVKDWTVWLRGPDGDHSFGDHADLLMATLEAVRQFQKENPPAAPGKQHTEASNKAAVGWLGITQQGQNDDAQRAAQAWADAKGGKSNE